MKASEHAEQAALFRWARWQEQRHPELALLHAIPNGGHRHVAVAKRMKAEGVRRGVPDLCLPVARGGFHGCYIELKTATGRLSPEQREWCDRLVAEGYFVALARGWESAARLLLDYLALDADAGRCRDALVHDPAQGEAPWKRKSAATNA